MNVERKELSLYSSALVGVAEQSDVMLRLEIVGPLTSGYYNEMEAGRPVFIGGEPLSEVVKEALNELGLCSEFSHGGKHAAFFRDVTQEQVEEANPFIGKKARLILEVYLDG